MMSLTPARRTGRSDCTSACIASRHRLLILQWVFGDGLRVTGYSLCTLLWPYNLKVAMREISSTYFYFPRPSLSVLSLLLSCHSILSYLTISKLAYSHYESATLHKVTQTR